MLSMGRLDARLCPALLREEEEAAEEQGGADRTRMRMPMMDVNVQHTPPAHAHARTHTPSQLPLTLSLSLSLVSFSLSLSESLSESLCPPLSLRVSLPRPLRAKQTRVGRTSIEVPHPRRPPRCPPGSLLRVSACRRLGRLENEPFAVTVCVTES